MNLICSVSLEGSLAFIIYLLMKPIADRRFSAVWQYTFLKIIMLFYLLPYQIFKLRYFNIIYTILGKGKYFNPACTGYVPIELNRTVIIGKNGLPYFIHRTPYLLLVSAWVFLAFFIIIKQIIKYFKCKKKLLMISENAAWQSLDIMEQCRQDIFLSSRKQVRLLQNKNISSPFSIGIFTPYIIIPESAIDKERQKMLLTHELTHIKNHDILFKFLSFFIILLHWFNPLAYLLFFELCNISERVCDEKVTGRMREKEKINYGMLVIEMAQKPSCVSMLFADSFSINANMMKNRIKCIKKTTVATIYMKMAAAAAAIIILLVSPLSVLAYEPLIISEGFTEETLINADMAYFISEEAAEEYAADNLENTLQFENSNEIFVDSYGNICDVSHPQNPAPNAVYSHSMASGQYYSHSPNGSGCTVTIYNADKCTKCSYIKIHDMISHTIYVKCPH